MASPSQMKYIIQILRLNKDPEEVELQQKEFEDLKRAKSCLSEALAIEEKYELLVSNYLDLEKERLILMSEYLIYNNKDYNSFFSIELAFNKRIINLLTSTKLYMDSVHQHAKICVPHKSIESVKSIDQEINDKKSLEYDHCFEYRFMEAFRNHVQHKGLSVNSIRIQRMSKDSIKIFAHKVEVARDTKFKKLVLEEMPDKVELIQTARIYIESINRIHLYVRELVSSDLNSARSLMENYINKYGNPDSSSGTVLQVASYISEGDISKPVEQFPLLLDWDDIRINLISKNGDIANFSQYYDSKNT